MNNREVSLKVFGRSDVGEVRDNNEDAFVIVDLANSNAINETPETVMLPVQSQGVLLAVSDGMGGAQAGEVASNLTLRSLCAALSESNGDPDERLRGSVEAANEEVWDVARRTGRLGMGATLTAILVQGRRAYVAEIGDSRAYLLRGGRFIQLTRDQNVSQVLIDSGKLTREQAEISRYKNIITQAIGTRPNVVVALNRVGLRRGDRLMLCSDGLSTKVNDDDIRSLLTTNRDLGASCRKLVEMANYRGGEDNVTVVVAEMEGEGLPPSTGDERLSLETLQAFDARDSATGLP